MPSDADSDRPDLSPEERRRAVRAVARTSDEAASAVESAAELVDTPLSAHQLEAVYIHLMDLLAATYDALETVEHQLDGLDDPYAWHTSRQILDEHADRIEEQYDRPVRELALVLLNHNRREWLQRKPDKQGADEMRRHGLTANQREWLNELQELNRLSDRPTGGEADG